MSFRVTQVTGAPKVNLSAQLARGMKYYTYSGELWEWGLGWAIYSMGVCECEQWC